MGDKETYTINTGPGPIQINGIMAAGAFAYALMKRGFEVQTLEVGTGVFVYGSYWVNMEIPNNKITQKWKFNRSAEMTFDCLDILIESIVQEAKEKGGLIS